MCQKLTNTVITVAGNVLYTFPTTAQAGLKLVIKFRFVSVFLKNKKAKND